MCRTFLCCLTPILIALFGGCSSQSVMRSELAVKVTPSGEYVVSVVEAKELVPQGSLLSDAKRIDASVSDEELVLFPRQAISATIERPEVGVIHSKPILGDSCRLDVVGKLGTVAGQWQPVGERAFRIRSVALSPCGRRIIFASKDIPISKWGIWVMGVDGRSPTFIGFGEDPSWLSESEILYSRNLDGHLAVYRVRCDGFGLKPVIADKTHDCIQATPSPDGEFVAFVKGVRGKPWTRDIWIHSLKSGESRQLTQDPARDDAPVWSRDGTEILFRSTRWALWGIWRIPVPADFGKRVVEQRTKKTDKGG